MTRYVKVKDHKDIARDMASNAIINTNSEALKKAREAKNKRLKEKERVDNLEKEVKDIHNKLDLILGLLGKDN